MQKRLFESNAASKITKKEKKIVKELKNKIEEEMYEITSPYYCAGLIVKNNTVIESAPIIKWMTGKNISEVEEYCKFKKFKFRKTWIMDEQNNEYIIYVKRIKINNVLITPKNVIDYLIKKGFKNKGKTTVFSAMNEPIETIVLVKQINEG